MRDKRHVGGDKMSVVDAEYGKVRDWAEYVLEHERRGLRGTIQDAAYQAERKYKVPATILLRVVQRGPDDMKARNWLAVKYAYEAVRRAVNSAADHRQFLAEQAGRDAPDTRLAAVASQCMRAATLLDYEED